MNLTSLTSKLSPITSSLKIELDKDKFHNHRLGFWLPQDREVIVAWVKQLMGRIRSKDLKPLDPTLVEFNDVVKNDPDLSKLTEDMFTEVPDVAPYNTDPDKHRQLQSWDELLQALNVLLTQGPMWSDIGPRLRHQATCSSFNPQVNACLKKILNKWTEYLKSPQSVEVLLPPNGWFGLNGGLQALIQAANPSGLDPMSPLNFAKLYKCPDPKNLKTFGFGSWEDFFSRDFANGMRQVAHPDDDNVIVHPCEAAPLQAPTTKVQLGDTFQGKNQQYTFEDMMDRHGLAQEFIGGTVYQAFLSAASYHKWNAPVSGTVVDIRNVPGTYYTNDMNETFPTLKSGATNGAADTTGQAPSKPEVANVATRALVFIQADNPAIGTVCFIGIGMAEMSGCEILVSKGQRVKKGDRMGQFHYGGSDIVMVFQNQASLTFDQMKQMNDSRFGNSPVNSTLATVSSS